MTRAGLPATAARNLAGSTAFAPPNAAWPNGKPTARRIWKVAIPAIPPAAARASPVRWSVHVQSQLPGSTDPVWCFCRRESRMVVCVPVVLLDAPIDHANGPPNQLAGVRELNLATDMGGVKGSRLRGRPVGGNDRQALRHGKGQLRLVEVPSRLLLQESPPTRLGLLAHVLRCVPSVDLAGRSLPEAGPPLPCLESLIASESPPAHGRRRPSQRRSG